MEIPARKKSDRKKKTEKQYTYRPWSRLGLRLLSKTGNMLPDGLYLRLQYRMYFGSRLNLEKPSTFQEKIQYLKLFDRNSRYTDMVDKIAAKDYVASIIGARHVIPTLGVWETFSDIDLNRLPAKFVLKTTHGGGSGGVVVCRDKKAFDKEHARRRIESSLKTDIYSIYKEWPYKNVPKRILAEPLIELPDKVDLTDYKIFCFSGKPMYIQVIQDRHSNETIDFFDTEWNHMEFTGLNPLISTDVTAVYSKSVNPIPRPTNLERMIEIASALSSGIPFVRIDLYNIEGAVYFGEITFYPAAGLGTFVPAEWNTTMGNLIELPSLK